MNAKKRPPLIAPRPDIENTPIKDEELLAFVKQGGVSAAEQQQDKPALGKTPKKAPKRRIGRTLRIPEAIHARIDAAIEARTLPISDNNWILEAIVEKLEREANS
jgi:predicted HicB family RNase H-like nuclease